MRHSIYSGRRKINWRSIKSARSCIALGVSTALGAGLFPVAPGTMGTLVGIPVAFFSQEWPWLFRFSFWIALFLLGSWSAKVFDETMQTQDNQNIVIDEVIGLGVSAWTAGSHFKTWVAAFCLFRFFDVLKPPPVRQIDQWSKKQESLYWGGMGVMADDLIAGFQALGLILCFQWLGILA